MGTLLWGWKEIAEFLGVTTRTARRWRHKRHLPVYNDCSTGRRAVKAEPAKLVRWVQLQSAEVAELRRESAAVRHFMPEVLFVLEVHGYEKLAAEIRKIVPC